MKITRYMGAFAVIAMLAACSTDDEQGTNTAANVLKTEDIHPPKTGISVHFSGSLV